MRADTLRPELKERISNWIISFYHLDPRYKILTFFNLVASEGADNIANDEEDDDPYDLDRGSHHNRRPLSNGEIADSDIFPSHSGTSDGDVNDHFHSERDRHGQNPGGRPSAAHVRLSTIRIMQNIFDATSILTVWRPCSNDAMRRMMEGTGVGKGLDIKGKSAKQGKLSAFVPFLQIHDEADKRKIQKISPDASMRVYYGTREARDYVMDALTKYQIDHPNRVAQTASPTSSSTSSSPTNHSVHNGNGNSSATSDLDSNKNNHNNNREQQISHINIIPTRMKAVDKYSHKGWFGLETSQRLFWDATVVPASIDRKGTGTETGRPSTPGFQDANMKTLKVACASIPKPSPMPVVIQYNTFRQHKHEQQPATAKGINTTTDDEAENDLNDDGPPPLSSALDPLHLVMAYEEIGTVTPVVSDFDAFLLGWRREALWFGCNLPRDQEELMMWCIDQIEHILDKNVESGGLNTDTWTCQWLDVLKRETHKGMHPDIPEYGFGDPKSYSIMEQAARRLKSTGAVRHGSECFNYYFPQEIDDVFLLISDTLRPVPWRYVNVQELQEILSQKVAEGFVFPLNPKWILCDPGWKKLYDDLMASDALYADLSKDVWYPPFSGVRERIESIYKRHPNGFQREEGLVCGRGSSAKIQSKTGYSPLRQNLHAGEKLSGNAAFDLAELELDEYIRTSVKHTLARQIREASLADINEDEFAEDNEGQGTTNFESGVGVGVDGSSKTVGSLMSDCSIGSESRNSGMGSPQLSKRSLFRKQRHDQLMEDSRYRGEKDETESPANETVPPEAILTPTNRRKMFSERLLDGAQLIRKRLQKEQKVSKSEPNLS